MAALGVVLLALLAVLPEGPAGTEVTGVRPGGIGGRPPVTVSASADVGIAKHAAAQTTPTTPKRNRISPPFCGPPRSTETVAGGKSSQAQRFSRNR